MTARRPSRSRPARRLANRIAAALEDGGVEVVHESFFDTVLAHVPGRAGEVVQAARAAGLDVVMSMRIVPVPAPDKIPSVPK